MKTRLNAFCCQTRRELKFHVRSGEELRLERRDDRRDVIALRIYE